MTHIVSIKFNPREAEVLYRAHAVSGTAGLSSHIKRVYFDALKLNVQVLEEVRDDLDRIASDLRRLEGGTQAADGALLLRITCGLYLMVRRSVGDSVRAQADLAIDVGAIEAYVGDAHDSAISHPR